MDAPTRRYQDVARFLRAYASAEGMRLGDRPATLDDVEHAERELGAAFPNSFRWFQLEFGDFDAGPLTIYSARKPEPSGRNIVTINVASRTELFPRIPDYLIAFSDNGGGDLLCFDTSRREADECPVVWWDHEQDEDQVAAEAAPSFLDWIEAELRERAAEEKGSVLDALPYAHWISEWLRRHSQ
jgi:cell wall assembly regulator SMI1